MTPVRYGQWKRWTDAMHGWRDGRAEIPAKLPSGARAAPVTTPHREALIRQAQDAFAYEHLEYRRLAAEPHRRIIADRARLEAAQSALTWANMAFDLESGALADREDRRRLGEEHHPDVVIVQRRRKERHKLLARAQAGVTRAQANHTAIDVGLAEALHEAEQQHKAAVIRVQRIHEHIHRRLAQYRRALVRAHPDGAWVNMVLSVQAPEIPGWALPDAYPPEGAPAESVPPAEDVSPDPEPEPGIPAAEIIELRHKTTHFGSYRPDGAESPAEQRDADDGTGYVTLDAPIAAPRHFTIVKADGLLQLRTRGYEHGPYIGAAVVGTAILKPADYFDFAEHRYTMLDADRIERTPLSKYDLIAAELRATSGSKARLSDMSFVQRENTLLAVLGPSGAGKSSLFGVLLGELPLDSGRLFFQKMSMATQSGQIRARLGFVPQQTDLHMSLTVAATLGYGFGLRSPGGRRSRTKAVDDALKVVELEAQRDQLLSTLSGGQLRRVSIALELLTNPPLLMLDEPTSGLDANMDRLIMTFLRQHAHEGHTVIVVTHATEHLAMADQVLVVVENGMPAYSGPPWQIRRHFGFKFYADLMEMLLAQPAEWARQYRAGRMAREAMREADKLEQLRDEESESESSSLQSERSRTPRAAPQKFGVLLKRQWLLVLTRGLTKNSPDRTWLHWARNARVVSMPLYIAAGSAALAALVAGSPGLGATPSLVGPVALTLLTTLCVLSGQALTYSDIVNELPILRREFRAGVGAFPVLTAKWLVYAVIAVGQAGLITTVFCLVPHRAPQRAVQFGPEMDLFIGLAALSVAAMTLGLLVSVMSAKLEQAVALVTLTSIFQIALNGVTSGLAKLSVTSVIAGLLPNRWGLAATASSIDLRGINAGHLTRVSTDALWQHTSGQWLEDLTALAVLSALFFAMAVWLLHDRLRPGEISLRRRIMACWNRARGHHGDRHRSRSE